MHSSLLVWAAALLLPLATSQNTTGPDADGKYWIYGQGISAAFIPYGASISNLLINDKNGIERDIVGGFDNASYCKFQPHTLLCWENNPMLTVRRLHRQAASALWWRSGPLRQPYQEQQLHH